MYQDASRNSVDAMTLASTMVDALAAAAGGLVHDGGMTPVGYVCTEEYNSLVLEYNDLLGESQSLSDAYRDEIARLKRQMAVIALENFRLRKMIERAKA